MCLDVLSVLARALCGGFTALLRVLRSDTSLQHVLSAAYSIWKRQHAADGNVATAACGKQQQHSTAAQHSSTIQKKQQSAAPFNNSSVLLMVLKVIAGILLGKHVATAALHT